MGKGKGSTVEEGRIKIGLQGCVRGKKRKEGKGFEEKKQRRRDDVRWRNEGKSCEGIK